MSAKAKDENADAGNRRQDVDSIPDHARDHTIDAFHRGRFFLVQPKDSGHRIGMDAMLLAATIPDGANGRLADLGAGAGGAGLAVLSRLDGVSASLVERSPIMAGYARRSLALEENSHLRGRTEIIVADVTLAGNARRAVGLVDDTYDFVILNPPFNEAADRKTPDALKAEAHAMEDTNLFESWLRTAGAILKPSGQVSVIARPHSLGPILDATRGRFGAIEITPVQPREGEDAIRILVTAIKQSRGQLALRPPLIIHSGDGHGFSEEMNACNNGVEALARRKHPKARKRHE